MPFNPKAFRSELHGGVIYSAQDLVNEVGNLSALTAAIDQTLLPTTTIGDLMVGTASAGIVSRLPIGTADQVLKVTGGTPVWSTTTTTYPTPRAYENNTQYNTGEVIAPAHRTDLWRVVASFQTQSPYISNFPSYVSQGQLAKIGPGTFQLQPFAAIPESQNVNLSGTPIDGLVRADPTFCVQCKPWATYSLRRLGTPNEAYLYALPDVSTVVEGDQIEFLTLVDPQVSWMVISPNPNDAFQKIDLDKSWISLRTPGLRVIVRACKRLDGLNHNLDTLIWLTLNPGNNVANSITLSN